jgi:ABC-2 type transport system permease protein
VNGFGISLDATHMRVAVVIEAPEETVRGFLAAMEASPYLAVQRVATAQQAETALSAGEVRGMLVLRQDAASRLRRSSPRPTPAALAVDATDPNTARLLEGYITGAASVWLSGLAHERRIPGAGGVSLEYRDWFNPELRSADFIVPGIIAMVMTMTGTLLTALIVAREWERGTMESMLASPARMTELLAAKLGCYFVLGLLSMAGSVVLAVVLFGIPFRGSLWALGAASALFLLFALGLGLFISTLARNQFVASQFSFVSTMMPAMMLSGMLFDIAAMPGWLQVVTYAVPARYLIPPLQTVFLAGDDWSLILPDIAAMLGFGLLFFVASFLVTRRSLD